MSLEGDIDNLVREELREEWKIVKQQIFVVDENDAYDLRFPGKWKQEFSTTNGAIIM